MESYTVRFAIIVFKKKKGMLLDLLRFQVQHFLMTWAITLLVMLEEDAAMLAFMLS